jgi:hypothetical protein
MHDVFSLVIMWNLHFRSRIWGIFSAVQNLHYFQVYRAQTETIHSVIGSKRLPSEIVILCCFNSNEKTATHLDCEATPYRLVREKAPGVSWISGFVVRPSLVEFEMFWMKLAKMQMSWICLIIQGLSNLKSTVPICSKRLELPYFL